MSAAPVAEPTAAPAAAEPSIDDLFAAAADELTTRTSEPAPERATPEDAPASESETRDEPADTTPSPERDESGRFKPKDGEPATDAPQPAQQQQQAPQREPTAEERAALLERQLQSVRGNAERDARMAAEKARQDALAEAEQNERQRISNLLNEYQRAGHDVTEARQQWAKQWADEDQAKQAQAQHQQRAGLLMSEVETDGQQKMLTLYHHGTKVLAEDTGLTHEEARGLWAEADERQRFLRASFQAQMAEKIPGAGFNKMALDDYMQTKVAEGKRLAELKQGYTKQLAERDKEIARLTKLLNRDEADTEALRGPEAPARGSGPRRKEATTLDEAGAELERRVAQMTRS